MPRQTRSPLRGRSQEVDVIRRRLEETRAGTGSAVIIEGSPGLGKTRLVGECAALAQGMSFQVGWGTTEPGRSVDELHALFDALFDGRPPLADRQALSDLHALPEFLFWLLQEVQAVIEEVALRGPLLLCLDDLHWAGATCAVAMRQLPARLAALPVLWVMTLRTDQGLPEIQQAKAALVDAGAEHIRLGPLERHAVAQLAEDILGAEVDEELLCKAARVQGNPFLLVEFFRGLLDDHLVSFDSGRATLVEDRLPKRLGVTMRRRLASMDPVSERVATFACGLGRRFTLHDLAAMTDISVPGLLPPVNQLLQADIFAEDDSFLTFRHDLIREAVRGSLAGPVRRAVDRHGADVLMLRGALPTEVAAQLAESAQPGDSAAIETILTAAQALTNSDPGGAAQLATRALELAPRQHPLRGPLVACRAVCLFTAGRAEEAKQFADSALRHVLPADEQARLRYHVSSMFDLSPVVRAESARAGLALPSLPAELRAALSATLYHSLSVAGYVEEAQEIRETARREAERSEDPAAWLRFGVPEAGVLYQSLEFQQALATVTDAVGRDHLGQEDARARLGHILRSWTLAALDRFDEALQMLNEEIIAAQHDRQNWALRVFETTRGRLALQMGDLTEAAVGLEHRFTVEEAHLVAGTLHAPAVVALGKLKIHIADEAGAFEVAEIAKVMLRSDAPYVRYHAAWYLALLSLSQSDPMAAHGWLSTFGSEERLQMFPLYPHEVTDDAERVRIAAAVGDAELAERAIALAQRRAELNPDVASCTATAAHCRGIWNESAEDLRLAASLYSDGKRPLVLASALEDLGRVLTQHGDNAGAVNTLDGALRLTTQFGATWDSARIRSRLRRLGVRRRPAAVERPKTGLEALTRTESAVARLAAEGNTDRQIAEKLFISPHTVHAHLRHIFDKLDVSSRVHLTRIIDNRYGTGASKSTRDD